jgi:N utilization substance protein A
LAIKLDKKAKQAEVVVAEDQLSLAIGREGQNVRLTSQLTDFKIEIKGKKVTASKKEKKAEEVKEEQDKKQT